MKNRSNSLILHLGFFSGEMIEMYFLFRHIDYGILSTVRRCIADEVGR